MDNQVLCYFCGSKELNPHSFKRCVVKETNVVIRTCEPCFYKNWPDKIRYPAL